MGKGGDGLEDGWLSGFAGRIESGRRDGPAGVPEAVKGRIVRESLEPGATVKEVVLRSRLRRSS